MSSIQKILRIFHQIHVKRHIHGLESCREIRNLLAVIHGPISMQPHRHLTKLLAVRFPDALMHERLDVNVAQDVGVGVILS